MSAFRIYSFELTYCGIQRLGAAWHGSKTKCFFLFARQNVKLPKFNLDRIKMVFCLQASSVRQGSCRASSGSPKETILEAQVQEMAKKTQERLVADVNLFSLKIPKHILCKIVSNSSEVIACDCLLKGIEPLCVIVFCRFVIINLIIHSKYFSVSDWLKSHA